MGYEIFEKLCKEKGVKAIEVCRETSVDQSTISAWKHGRYTPNRDKMEKIAGYFGVSVDYLLTGTVPEKKPAPANFVIEGDGMEILIEAARGSDPEALRLAAEILYKMKGSKGEQK